jgi:Arylsulfotransferase (ASST)
MEFKIKVRLVVIKALSRVVILLSIFTLGAWSTKHSLFGGTKIPHQAKQIVIGFADLPVKFKLIYQTFLCFLPPKGSPDHYSDYRPNRLSGSALSGFILVPLINEEGVNQFRLINLANCSERTIYESNEMWPKSHEYSDILYNFDSTRVPPFSHRGRTISGHLSKTGILVYALNGNDLIAVDIRSQKPIWRIKGTFHHSIEMDHEGNYWACGASMGKRSTKELGFLHSNSTFIDQHLVQVSPAGRILQNISLADLLMESGLEFLLYGISNPDLNHDPLHLNQITPVLEDSGVFRKGQLLVSARNMSAIFLVDLETKKILWHKIGPWMNQHSVKVYSNSTFSLLDNHSFASGNFWLASKWASRIVTHNLQSGETTVIPFNIKQPRKMRLAVEGRVIPINGNTWLFEDCHQGTIMIFKDGDLAFKWSNSYKNGKNGITSWCQYIPENDTPSELREL